MSRKAISVASGLPLILTWSLMALAQKPNQQEPSAPTIPTYCNPCLDYSGDFDVNNPLSNGLANGCTLTDGCTRPSEANVVYIPFTVPVGQEWEVSGLFTNNMSTGTVFDPPRAFWSIASKIKVGAGAKVIYQGTSPASFTLTNQGVPLINVYNVLVRNIKTPSGQPIVLTSGTYWLTVVPLCINSNDSACSSAEYFAADVEDMPPPNQYGPPEPWDDSFFYSPTFSYNFEPTWGASGPCSGDGCDAFSAGVLGKIRNVSSAEVQ